MFTSTQRHGKYGGLSERPARGCTPHSSLFHAIRCAWRQYWIWAAAPEFGRRGFMMHPTVSRPATSARPHGLLITPNASGVYSRLRFFFTGQMAMFTGVAPSLSRLRQKRHESTQRRFHDAPFFPPESSGDLAKIIAWLSSDRLCSAQLEVRLSPMVSKRWAMERSPNLELPAAEML